MAQHFSVLRFSIAGREISVAYNKVFILCCSPGVLNTITSQTGAGHTGTLAHWHTGTRHTGQVLVLQREVAKLKVDKLELLRQNVSAQREVKLLRERETQLSGELSGATKEINKLRLVGTHRH